MVIGSFLVVWAILGKRLRVCIGRRPNYEFLPALEMKVSVNKAMSSQILSGPFPMAHQVLLNE